MNQRHTMTGFSLVELMVALTLGLLLTFAIGSLFYENKRNYQQNSLISEMQDNARFAVQALSRDLSMAGYLGGMLDSSQLETDSPTLPVFTVDCDPGADEQGSWPFDRDAIEFISGGELTNDNPPVTQNASYIADRYNCVNASHIVPDTDVLSIRRTAGIATEEANLEANTFYLRTNQTVGSVFFSGTPASEPGSGHPPDTTPRDYWEYDSHLYFIRTYAQTVGDGIPSLCRAYLADTSPAKVETECVAEGVQDMEIAFGIDTNGDGIANRYLSNPDRDQLRQATTARVQLLMRSVGRDHSYENDKTYNMLGEDDDGDGTVDEAGEGFQGQGDPFYRRVVQTTVVLRNPAMAARLTP